MLRSMVGGAGALVTLMPQQTDRYSRTVAEVYAGGQNVNLEMVRQGRLMRIANTSLAVTLLPTSRLRWRRAQVSLVSGASFRSTPGNSERADASSSSSKSAATPPASKPPSAVAGPGQMGQAGRSMRPEKNG